MSRIVFPKLWAALSGEARRQKLRLSKQTTLRGKKGVALSSIDRIGSAMIEGELWKVTSNTQIEKGTGIKVTGTDGVFVCVEPVQ